MAKDLIIELPEGMAPRSNDHSAMAVIIKRMVCCVNSLNRAADANVHLDYSTMMNSLRVAQIHLMGAFAESLEVCKRKIPQDERPCHDDVWYVVEAALKKDREYLDGA